MKKPPPFIGKSYASIYAYDNNLKKYYEMIKYQKGTIRMIKYIFPEPVFLDICDNKV